MLKEFKEFAMRGSVVDLAVGVIIGAAFGVFLVMQQVNRWTKKPAPAAAPTTKECPQCAMSIPMAAKRCGHCTAQLA